MFGDTGGALTFQQNLGNGTFSAGASVTTPSFQPRILVPADFDRDGKEDLAVGFLFDT